MPRGRPLKSHVRQNMIEILGYMKKVHGYHLYTIYKAIFPAVSMRAIYYNLKKGLETGEFEVAGVEKQRGNYSWGGEVERTYYKLGDNAITKGNNAVKEYLAAKGAGEAQKES